MIWPRTATQYDPTPVPRAARADAIWPAPDHGPGIDPPNVSPPTRSEARKTAGNVQLLAALHADRDAERPAVEVRGGFRAPVLARLFGRGNPVDDESHRAPNTPSGLAGWRTPVGRLSGCGQQFLTDIACQIVGADSAAQEAAQ